MLTRSQQVAELAKRIGIAESQMDDFIWTFCTRLILNQADEYHFNKTFAEISREADEVQP